MASVATIVTAMRRSPANIKFSDAVKVCEHYFGAPRQQSSSHLVFRMPWLGDPRVNLQPDKGKAKPYQVKQILAAIDKKEENK